MGNTSSGTVFAVTSENEWYKAAYYQPVGAGGDTDSYWLYPTASNSITTSDANYIYSVGNVTDVGTYAANPSYYGTFDQGGNVREWNDAIVSASHRGRRGGEPGRRRVPERGGGHRPRRRERADGRNRGPRGGEAVQPARGRVPEVRDRARASARPRRPRRRVDVIAHASNVGALELDQPRDEREQRVVVVLARPVDA